MSEWMARKFAIITHIKEQVFKYSYREIKFKGWYNNWYVWRNHSCTTKPTHISSEIIIKKTIQYFKNLNSFQ